MNTRLKIAALVAAQKKGAEAPEWAMLGGSNACTQKRTQNKQELLGVLLETKPRDQETKSNLKLVTTQAALDESYKAQKRQNFIEAELLIERYGDVMKVIDNHPLFRRPTAPRNEGGWGLYPQKLTLASKKYSVDGDLSTGLQYVINCVRFVANKRSAKNPGGYLLRVLENGIKQEG